MVAIITFLLFIFKNSQQKLQNVHKSVDLSRVNSLRSPSAVSSTGGVDGARLNDAMETSGVSDGGSVPSTFLSSINNVGLSETVVK